MKKLLSTLFVLFFVSLTMFANGQKESSPVAADEPVVLEWWTWDPDMKRKESGDYC